MQERQCDHKSNLNCSNSHCQIDYVTYHDELLLQLSFSIIISIELVI